MTNNTCNFGQGSKNSGNFVEALFDMFNTAMTGNMVQTTENQDRSFAFRARLNVVNHDDTYMLELLIPGAQKEDIKIAYDDKVLTISYEREKNDTQYMKKEFGFDHYERKIRIRPNMDLENMEAEYQNGVLTLSIPKKEKTTPELKEVSIK